MINIADLKAARDAAYTSYELLSQLVTVAANEEHDRADPLAVFSWEDARMSSPFYVTYKAAQASYYSLDRMYVSHPDYVPAPTLFIAEDWQNA